MAASISKTLRITHLFVCLPSSGASLHRLCIPSAPLLSPFSTNSSAISSINDPLSNPSSQPQNQGAQHRGIWSKMLLFVPGAITFGLGTWQIFRRQDKIKMLDYRKERLEMEPIELNAIFPVENPNTLEFRRVVCRGAFDEKSIFVGPRSRSISGVTENGYYLITPLLHIPGDPESVQSPVLVNRGWVPRSWKDKALESLHGVEEAKNVPSFSSSHDEKHSFWSFWSKRPKGNEEQTPNGSLVEVVGVIRGSEKPNMFVPENDPISFQWFYVDVAAIASALGLPENTTYMEDTNQNISPGNSYPTPKDTTTLIRSSVMPQDHLNYTLTWSSLSVAVTFMAYKRLKPGKRRR